MSNRVKDILGTLIRLYCERPKESVSEWACRCLRFNEPNNRGPFTLLAREYNREPIDEIADPTITDQVLVYGAQTGKTASIMAMIAWIVRWVASRVLWVMPNSEGTGGAKNFSATRWQPMILASEEFNRFIPVGRNRHAFKNMQQRLNGAIIDFVGSHSPANLASNPSRVQVLDEVDKFDTGGGQEADAVSLAEQRGKSFGSPKRIKTSTPTVYEGLIWQEFLKGDQRRYFVPCVHCGKFVVFAWSAPFTVFKKTGDEAYVFWSREAKRADGTWDFDVVKQTAHAKCPHCAGKINEADKSKMVRRGEWRATNPNAPRHFRSRHLPSLYASSPQTSFGALAVRFLQAKASLTGLQDFINGELAEPYQSQDRQSERIELITQRIEVTAEWQSILSVDCQGRAPHFWYVKRNWNGAESVGIESGSCDTWDELRSIQNRPGATVPDSRVIVDSGFGARSDADVYATCAGFGELIQRGHGIKPLHLGWLPAKGFPVRKRWKDPDSGLLVPYYLRGIDPFLGTANAGRVEMSLFEFSGEFFKDILEAMRRGKGGSKWSVLESAATEEYWRHLDAKIKTALLNKRTGQTTHQWALRSAHWPDHLDDCEIMNTAYANFCQLFTLPEQ